MHTPPDIHGQLARQRQEILLSEARRLQFGRPWPRRLLDAVRPNARDHSSRERAVCASVQPSEA